MMLPVAQAIYVRIMSAPDLPARDVAGGESPCGLAEEGLDVTRLHDSDDPERCSACRDDYLNRMKEA